MTICEWLPVVDMVEKIMNEKDVNIELHGLLWRLCGMIQVINVTKECEICVRMSGNMYGYYAQTAFCFQSGIFEKEYIPITNGEGAEPEEALFVALLGVVEKYGPDPI